MLISRGLSGLLLLGLGVLEGDVGEETANKENGIETDAEVGLLRVAAGVVAGGSLAGAGVARLYGPVSFVVLSRKKVGGEDCGQGLN